MSNWTTSNGYRTTAIKIGNATVTIHRPILEEDARRKREEQIKEALVRYAKESN